MKTKRTNIIHLSISLLITLILICSFSCKHSIIRSNEKKLVSDLLSLKKDSSEVGYITPQYSSAESLKTRSKALKLREDRSVDLVHPPEDIDIAGNLNNIKEIRLSDVASQIIYVRLQQPPDSVFRSDMGFKYYLTDDFIIAANLYGILQFTLDGRFVNTIVKNKFTGMTISPDQIHWGSGYTFLGTFKPTIRSIGSKLYYFYLNNVIGQEYIMEYDLSETKIGTTIKFDPENPSKILGQGKIHVDLNNGTLKPEYIGGNWSAGGSPNEIYRNTKVNLINNNTYTKRLIGKDMLGIFNIEGDTLVTFKQNERLISYTKSIMRRNDLGDQYEFENKFFCRNPYNDTVFMVIPPNRLFPVYVLKLNSYKATIQQGMDPGFNLEGKIIPNEFAETRNYIFITFSKDNYDSPMNRKKKDVKIYHAIYSKLNHEISIIKGDPLDYSPEILENNIDGGVPVWPVAYMIGKQGEILLSLKGRQLKDRVKSTQFERSEAPKAQKEMLKQLAASVSDLEDILMIVK